jgi:hypothetical protein
VVVFELACRVENNIGSLGSGLPTSVVLEGESSLAVVTIGAPKVADGVLGEAQFGRDLGQALAIEMAVDDVDASLDRNGARHGRAS